MNLYGFVNNDVINKWDYMGKTPFLAAVALIAAIVVRHGAPYFIAAKLKFPDDDGRMQHCWTSCMIVRDGGLGVSVALGGMKEVRDVMFAAINAAAKSMGYPVEGDFGHRMMDVLDDIQRNVDGYECGDVCVPGTGIN